MESVELVEELPEERMSRITSLLCSLVPPTETHCPSGRVIVVEASVRRITPRSPSSREEILGRISMCTLQWRGASWL